jgi:hypothetical protein
VTAIELKIGLGAGSLYVEEYPREGEFSLNLRPSHGGPEYRIVGISPDQLGRLAIALVAIPSVRATLAAVRELIDRGG